MEVFSYLFRHSVECNNKKIEDGLIISKMMENNNDEMTMLIQRGERETYNLHTIQFKIEA